MIRVGLRPATGVVAKGLCWIVFAFAIAGCGDNRVPKLTFDSQLIDMGTVPMEGGAADIAFGNTGLGVLRIERVSTSCQCTVVDKIADVRPGKRGSLQVKVPGQAIGPQAARIVVFSNDPTGPHELQCRWYGQSPPRLIPAQIDARRIAPDAAFAQDVSIVYGGGDPMQAVELESFKSSLEGVEFVAVSNDSRAIVNTGDPASNSFAVSGELHCQFRFRTPRDGQFISGHVEISVALAKRKYQLILPFDVEVLGPFEARPERLVLTNQQSSGAPVSKTLKLRPRTTGLTPTLKSISAGLKCELVGRQEEDFLLRVTLIDAPSGVLQRSEVVVGTTEDGASLRIPVTVLGGPNSQ